ncbi:MAG: type III-B CRISPR module RAMP protein Cmr4 [Thermodesulfobacterium sp.]|nr:type III-B CRISPR module RAMP protein Cmr4 [Thermodesulfobacterium sp.]
MFQEKALLTFYAETPIHMGAGQSLSYVDLPVQRERITGFPTLWASGIKGVIRDLATRKWNNDKNKVEVIFGPEESAEEFASCISITDAKILLYPIRSVRGVFAWITCPFVLKRFKGDLKSIGLELKNGKQEIKISDFEVEEDEVLVGGEVLKINENKIALEEFVFNVKKEERIKNLSNSFKNFLPENELIDNLEDRLVIVSDDVFKDFVNYAVEIRTRIKIDQTTGTVEEKALFTEELIPSESIFYSLTFITDPYLGLEAKIYDKLKDAKINKKLNLDKALSNLSEEERKKILKNNKLIEKVSKAYSENYFVAKEIKDNLDSLLNNELLQLGGDETIGMGFMRVKFYYNDKKNQEA